MVQPIPTAAGRVVQPFHEEGAGVVVCGAPALRCCDCGHSAGCVEHAYRCTNCGAAVCVGCRFMRLAGTEKRQHLRRCSLLRVLRQRAGQHLRTALGRWQG